MHTVLVPDSINSRHERSQSPVVTAVQFFVLLVVELESAGSIHLLIFHTHKHTPNTYSVLMCEEMRV